MPRTRPPYPPEFRLEAVRMLRAGVRSLKQLAEELGCSAQTLRNWLRQDQADRGARADVLSSEERQGLRELERENKVLRQEREILSAAIAGLQLGTEAAARDARRQLRGYVAAAVGTHTLTSGGAAYRCATAFSVRRRSG